MRYTKERLRIRRGSSIKEAIPADFRDSFAIYSMLSANIYDDSTPFKLPQGWEKIPDNYLPEIPSPQKKSQFFIKGLKFQIWSKKKYGTIEVVLVFKGTTITTMGDWISNFRWIVLNTFGRNFLDYFFYDYYHQVRAMIDGLIKFIKEYFPGQEVLLTTTGHSLGGGLAQQAAYATNEIKRVVAFHPSPVTGFMDIDDKIININKKNTKISRVFHSFEILAIIRGLIRSIYPLEVSNPEITEYEYTFMSGNIFERHGIKSIAKYLYDKRP